MSIKSFLTAYDPSDLPSGSLDPLGFDRGYLYLAEKILPNMTNVASCPRYFGMICASVLSSGVDPNLPNVKRKKRRQDAILRLEKLWALGNVLAAKENGQTNLSGLRGVTYAERQVNYLLNNQIHETDLNFDLLSRQITYGAIGMYAAVASACKLLDRKTLDLTPGLGEPLGTAFITETQMPPSVKKSIRVGSPVSIKHLSKWCQKAFLWRKPGAGERKFISELLSNNPIRYRFSKLLAEFEATGDEPELKRLSRIASAIKGSVQNRDLWESAVAIIRYESCYRLSQLALERLIFLCRNRSDASGGVSIQSAANDEVIKLVKSKFPRQFQMLNNHLNVAKTAHFESKKKRLDDTLHFLEDAKENCKSGASLIESIINRHNDVQHGKFDRGRRKMPWIQIKDGLLYLTLTRVGGLRKEAKTPAHITPHFYRMAAADKWIVAAGGHEYWRS